MSKALKFNKKAGALAGLAVLASVAFGAPAANAQYLYQQPQLIDEQSLLDQCGISYNQGAIIDYQCPQNAQLYTTESAGWPRCTYAGQTYTGFLVRCFRYPTQQRDGFPSDDRPRRDRHHRGYNFN